MWTINYGDQITIFNSTTVITPNSDGTATSTTTTTTASFPTAVPGNDNVGNVKFSATSQTETHTFDPATGKALSAYSMGDVTNISHADAAKVFGTQTLTALSSPAIEPQYGAYFAHAVRHDPNTVWRIGDAVVLGIERGPLGACI